MKYIIILLFFFLFSCKNETSKSNGSVSNKTSNKIKTQFKEIKSDTLIVNNLKFIIQNLKFHRQMGNLPH